MDGLFDDEAYAKLSKARALWEGADHNLDGTPAERYLYSLGGKPPWPAVLRYSADLYHGVSRQSFPALIAAATDPHGNVMGVQRHYFGEGITPPRLMLGSIAGNAVRVGYWRTRKSELVIAESLELALRVHFRTGLPVLVVLSAAGFRQLRITHDDRPTDRTVGLRLLFAPTSAAGRAAAEKYIPAWEHAGHSVRIVDGIDLIANRAISIDGGKR